MSTIDKLTIQNFRNITAATLEFSATINAFYGKNGAGKTTVLEAMHYLSLGRSFRTNHAQHIIKHGTNQFAVFAYLLKNDLRIPIGIEKSIMGQGQIRINGETISTLSSLVKQLPTQFISAMSYRFFFNGPKVRRQFLDWLLFHVEQSFFAEWQLFQRALKQRNASIKARVPAKQIALWDEELIRSGSQIDVLRKHSLTEFEPIFIGLLKQLLPNYPIQLSYFRGWNKEKTFELALQHSLERDLQFGFTQTGPQRADIKLLIDGIPAQDVLSQGQQKLTLYAFHLAQGTMLKEKLGKGPIYLIDDVTSELDQQKQACISNVLTEIDSQVFITGVSKKDFERMFDFNQVKMFHVEQGGVTPQ